MGIETVLATTGDFVALGKRAVTTTVRDVDVFGLVELAREAGLQTGVVLDPRPESNGLWQAVRWLERKVEAGAQFAVTQPLYDDDAVELLYKATKHIDIPIIMGVLPLRTHRHAEFLHTKVSGIAIPEPLVLWQRTDVCSCREKRRSAHTMRTTACSCGTTTIPKPSARVCT